MYFNIRKLSFNHEMSDCSLAIAWEQIVEGENKRGKEEKDELLFLWKYIKKHDNKW